MSPYVVIWSAKPGITGNNVTMFDTEAEAREFGEHLIALKKSYSVTVCRVIRYHLQEK